MYSAKGTRPSVIVFGQGDSAKYSRIQLKGLGQVFSYSAKGTRPSIVRVGQGDSAEIFSESAKVHSAKVHSAEVFSESAKVHSAKEIQTLSHSDSASQSDSAKMIQQLS